MNQTEFCLVHNQSENGKYNLISVNLTSIAGGFFCVLMFYFFAVWKALIKRTRRAFKFLMSLKKLKFPRQKLKNVVLEIFNVFISCRGLEIFNIIISLNFEFVNNFNHEKC